MQTLRGWGHAIQPRTQPNPMGPFLSEFSSLWSCLVCRPQAAGCVLTHLTAGHAPLPAEVFWFGQCIPQSLGFWVKVGMFPLGERQLVQTSRPAHCFPLFLAAGEKCAVLPTGVRHWLGTRTDSPFFILKTCRLSRARH